MDSPIPDDFDEEYAEIKEIVAAAKDLTDEENYQKAKHHFLDAAQKTLEISKKVSGSEQVTFRNIARILVDQAKEMQQLIEIQRNPLPTIPGSQPTSPLKTPKEFSKKDDPILLQMMIIQTTGIPIFTWTGKKLSEKVQTKINDILFSGAITAVNSLISEVLSKPIQAIQFEDGNIVLKFIEDLIFVAFTEGESELLEDNIEKFSSDFCSKIYPRNKAEISQGKVLNENKEIHDLVEECFVVDM